VEKSLALKSHGQNVLIPSAFRAHDFKVKLKTTAGLNASLARRKAHDESLHFKKAWEYRMGKEAQKS
jgi:hypothetical protein